MTPEQLKWTDEQWAKHLQCNTADVPRFRDFVTETFIPYVISYKANTRYAVAIDRRHDTPSGAYRLIPMITSERMFPSENQAIDYANNELFPSLALNPIAAAMHKIPTNALNLLHLEKQKQK